LRSRAAEDQELAERAGRGDHAAFTLLFERYKAGIYRFCYLMLGDQQAAEDVYQDVFVNFYRACRSGQTTMYNVRSYLISAARSSCINVMRFAKHTTDLDDAPEPFYELDLVEEADTETHLQAALQAIAPQYREVFILFEYEGYSYEEIARQLDISYDVVKNRLYRAKLALQKILRPLLRENPSNDE
jgi:RNA polymerase sigma-70 factor (ECF subfamily)